MPLFYQTCFSYTHLYEHGNKGGPMPLLYLTLLFTSRKIRGESCHFSIRLPFLKLTFTNMKIRGGIMSRLCRYLTLSFTGTKIHEESCCISLIPALVALTSTNIYVEKYAGNSDTSRALVSALDILIYSITFAWRREVSRKGKGLLRLR